MMRGGIDGMDRARDGLYIEVDCILWDWVFFPYGFFNLLCSFLHLTGARIKLTFCMGFMTV